MSKQNRKMIRNFLVNNRKACLAFDATGMTDEEILTIWTAAALKTKVTETP